MNKRNWNADRSEAMRRMAMAAVAILKFFWRMIAAPECKLPIVQNVIRRLSLSGYSDIVLMSPCLPEK